MRNEVQKRSVRFHSCVEVLDRARSQAAPVWEKKSDGAMHFPRAEEVQLDAESSGFCVAEATRLPS